MNEATEIKKGLAGVVVDSTAVSKVMPEINSLTYRGYAVQELCAKTSFEAVAHLLLRGELPTPAELAEFQSAERAQRGLSKPLEQMIGLFPKTAHPMDALRTALSFLALEDPVAKLPAPAGNYRKALSLLAKTPTCIAYHLRQRKGLTLIPPRSDLSFSENFFHMCFDAVPEREVISAFDASLILYAEHSFNASTFTARVITSSLSELYGAIVGAVASLKGPLHGGANEAVMHMLKEIETPEKANDWVRSALREKRVIMGFGHRVYKKQDSRVPTMKEKYLAVARLKKETKLPALSQLVEDIMRREKNLYPNLDFPAGPAYYLMGFDIDFFTPIFVMSRIAGWSAHIFEQSENNRLIRPLSHYHGPAQRTIPA